MASITAYWIAFGPHGPRAETPKGEGLRIVVQITKYLVISAAVFFAIRSAAGPAPRTMTKEWQEATNEYALVCTLFFLMSRFKIRWTNEVLFTINRKREWILSLVSAVKDTKERASSSLLLRRSNRWMIQFPKNTLKL